ncbi:AAC_HP2_G0006930.mRNA.1.CDS.1 [Saccharomyces cerevisiae]|nr:AAC_HP2_G0006930.mRNA.1.CDS.1 [Saccharomyces cerevisiae]CAI6417391.1 AAC_HP2_G0006930.mRNA.1.CDS.1 [Saccharomyces cerevisiae]CAI6421427.1 AAC_HP1_G0008010.mRNA.1.CDS.1 [Saccharomyces cerevisiae]CAI6533203.1 AAC_collapsed_G0007230.mRNA.1.CDS.1 [Saccharomyces cerevisiae]
MLWKRTCTRLIKPIAQPRGRLVRRSCYRYASTGTGSTDSSSQWLKYSVIASSATLFGYLFAKNLYSRETKEDLIEKLEMVKKIDPVNSTLKLSSLDSPDYLHDPVKIDKVVEDLKQVLGNKPENYSDAKSDLDAHSDTYFNTHHPSPEQRPRIILFPHTTEEVSKILKICHDNNMPVVPFSGGTSLEGHFLPTRIGDTITVDLSKFMNNVVKFDKLDLDITVQAGLPWEDLNDYLSDHGLMFGCDPGPGAQIGGCIANSCSGTNAYRYGTMKENIINMTIVFPDGTIVKTKKRPRKSSAGYNLNGLFVGSEGTLGIVTEATVKCHVKPKAETVAVVSFDTIKDAAACASNLTQSGIHLNAMELLDENMMKLINASESTDRCDWVEKPTMFFKIGGRSPNIVNALVDEVKAVAQLNHCNSFQFAKDDDEKLELWEARKVALWSVLDADKSKDKSAKIWTTDVAVPVSQFDKVIHETKKGMQASKLINAIVGHAGDGNFHAFIVYRTPEEHETCSQLVDRMVKRALNAEGTCTGEHGVGIGKREYLLEELGEAPVDLMRKIKLAIDPKRIMNPDKIFKTDPNEPANDYR